MTCGKGRRSRDVQCLDTYGVPSNDCSIREKPTEVELCKQGPCSRETVSGKKILFRKQIKHDSFQLFSLKYCFLNFLELESIVD